MTDVREHGLIYSAQMIRALLPAPKIIKTMTRRPVSRVNSLVDGYRWPAERWAELRFEDAWIDRGPSPVGNPGPYLQVPRDAEGDHFVHRVYPVYQPGDTMWARETWRIERRGEMLLLDFAADTGAPTMSDVSLIVAAAKYADSEMRWRSPIHLPRWASRIVRRIGLVRPERLGEISEGDVQAEGCTGSPYGPSADHMLFPRLWEQIYGTGAWERDERRWLWVIGGFEAL